MRLLGEPIGNWPSMQIATLVVVMAMVVAACGSGDDSSGQSQGGGILPGAESTAPPPPDLDAAAIATGEELYRQNCASCHGVDLAGNPDWKTPNADGSYPPPPHDSSGHTWHHGDQFLVDLIRDGLDLPISRMPSFGDQLTDDQLTAILEYLKSNWGPDERAFQWEISQRENPDE